MVKWLIDRSGDMRGLNLMCLFNNAIRDLRLMDIPLKNCAFTWSSKRLEPVFSKLDRVFLSPQWSVQFPIITLEAFEMTVSNHPPLLLTCKQQLPQKIKERIEASTQSITEVAQHQLLTNADTAHVVQESDSIFFIK